MFGNNDLSYLQGTYADQKKIEEFNKEKKMKDDIDLEVQFDNMRQSVEDNCRWTTMELSNEIHGRKVRLNKSRGYLEDAMMQIDEVLGQMGDAA